MALDHFVPQVYLRNFYSPALGERLFAVRKSSLKRFTPGARAICGIADGNTNEFLTEPRAIEELLREIEPKLNRAIGTLYERKIDREAIFVVAAMAAYISTCAPAAMRIRAQPMKALIESEARLLDRSGAFGVPPEALGAESLSELIDSGRVRVKVDERAPVAVKDFWTVERR